METHHGRTEIDPDDDPDAFLKAVLTAYIRAQLEPVAKDRGAGLEELEVNIRSCVDEFLGRHSFWN